MTKLAQAIENAFAPLKAISLDKYMVAVGQKVEFDYKGEHRGGTVHTKGRTVMTLKTAGGYRSFSYAEIHNFKVV